MLHYLLIAVRGVLMGAADVVPGVSGGTVALVVGIYDRLVAALSHFDLTLLRHLRDRQFKQAAAHIDLPFLAALGIGILSGIVVCGGLVNHLLTSESTRSATLAAFFGMILASCAMVIRLIPAKSVNDRLVAVFLGAVGIAVAYVLTSLPTSEVELTYWYLFLSGAIAICAMILPGISGAYILLILGVYVAVTDIIKRLPKADIDGSDLAVVVVFASGCLVGLLSFSKVLKWLLSNYESHTLAVLVGFMLGALHRIWPFQHDLTPDVHELKHKEYELYMPSSVNATVVTAIVVAGVAFAAVLLIDYTLGVRKQVEEGVDELVD